MRYLIVCMLTGIYLLQTGCATDPVSQDGPMDFPKGYNPDSIPDAIPRSEPLSRFGNPTYYDVYGKRYYVRKSSKDFRQEGIASWYGKQFHGRRTSSGEMYDMFKMTAAHKTLPLPTYVKVANQKNGRTIVVKVNDRGPFHSNRIIDLSYAAAVKLGITASGTAPVLIEAINDHTGSLTSKPIKEELFSQENSIPQPLSQTNSLAKFVQLGIFSKIDNARRLQEKMLHSALPTPEIMTVTINDANLYRVVIGPLESVNHLEIVNNQLDKLGIPHRQMTAPVIP